MAGSRPLVLQQASTADTATQEPLAERPGHRRPHQSQCKTGCRGCSSEAAASLAPTGEPGGSRPSRGSGGEP